jgi:hypothetical protein
MSEVQQTEPKPKARVIYMYRMVQGNKVRWKFEVDSQMVILNEGPAENQSLAVQHNVSLPGSKPVDLQPDKMAQYKKVLEERGITYSTTATGQVIIQDIPSKEKIIMQFFDLNAPCPDVAGLEDIREKFKQEYEKAGGAACPSCQLNTLQRKYREILKHKIP